MVGTLDSSTVRTWVLGRIEFARTSSFLCLGCGRYTQKLIVTESAGQFITVREKGWSIDELVPTWETACRGRTGHWNRCTGCDMLLLLLLLLLMLKERREGKLQQQVRCRWVVHILWVEINFTTQDDTIPRTSGCRWCATWSVIIFQVQFDEITTRTAVKRRGKERRQDRSIQREGESQEEISICCEGWTSCLNDGLGAAWAAAAAAGAVA